MSSNINLAPLIAGAGIAGVALGFGAQQIVRDYLSGVFIVSEDQFGAGDTIDLQDVSGTVEAVSLRSTKVRDVDGVLWTVANGEILKVGNATKGWSRSKLDVSRGLRDRPAPGDGGDPGGGRGAAPGRDWAMDVLEPPDMWGIQHLAADGVTIRLVAQGPSRPPVRGDPRAPAPDRGTPRGRGHRDPLPPAHPLAPQPRGRVRPHRRARRGGRRGAEA